MHSPDNWFLVQLKPNTLAQATRNLSRQGIGTFMPVRDIGSRRGQQVVVRKKPIFPGYLFVNFDPKKPQWRAINSTYGVARLVTFNQGPPQPLPKSLILGLMARCDENGCFLPPDDFQAGERVRAISGPFVDFIAEIEDVPDQQRVGVLFEIMGRSVRAIMSQRDVERIEN